MDSVTDAMCRPLIATYGATCGTSMRRIVAEARRGPACTMALRTRIIVGKHTENDSLLGAVGLVLRHQTKELSLG